ncbi:peritrophin-1 [Drosophila guanche]|uniref:Blast:Probable chitinase 3 n=1 Tax=Drosophila guanche TaxID=7266 RepID=A0A3B0KLJ3_DROGU|nr:peritrophin-1 [Drosophila guanche]SPP84688.1 blast:Probable chitinase 3 [Drosophila guanche]
MRGLCTVVTFAFLVGYAVSLPFDDEYIASAESTTLDPSTETEPQDIETTLPPPVLCEEGEEFLAAPNCQQFYQCLYGEGVLKLCPPDLYWDPALDVCGWDSKYCENVDEPTGKESDCSSGLPFLPYELDCSKYIQCVYNTGIKQNCPMGLFWNQPLQRCDYTCDSRFAYSEDDQEQ